MNEEGLVIKAKLTSMFGLILVLLVATAAFAQGDGTGRGQGGAGRGQGEHTESVVSTENIDFNTSNTIREIAHGIGVTGSELAQDLGLSIEVDKDMTLIELGVEQSTLDRALEHILGHEDSELSQWKYPIYTLIVIFAGLFLLWLGIPKNADRRKRKGWYPQWIYTLVLAISVGVLGFWLGKSPNPMEAVVKVPKAILGLYDSVPPYVLALSFFLVLAIIVNKAVCGWACPFGALEELIYMLPLFKRAKKWQPPFWITNTIRTLLFIVFILLAFGYFGAQRGFVVYHYLNPFNLFNFDFSTAIVPWVIGIYLVLSFFFYRPFCRIICPFGLLSWIAERISLNRIVINRETCIDCRACAKACPLTAAKDRLDKSPLPADCFACARCLRVCPTDAIDWKWSWQKGTPGQI